jgi:acetyl-CoA carboxylase beta subunit
MVWFKKERPESAAQEAPAKKVKIPEGLWVKCDNCKEMSQM